MNIGFGPIQCSDPKEMKMQASMNQQRAAQRPDAGERDQKGEMAEMGDAGVRNDCRLSEGLEEGALGGFGGYLAGEVVGPFTGKG
jgi:hypothetical protein